MTTVAKILLLGVCTLFVEMYVLKDIGEWRNSSCLAVLGDFTDKAAMELSLIY